MTQIVNPFEEILPKKESLPYIILYHITDEKIVQSRIRFDPGNMEISLVGHRCCVYRSVQGVARPPPPATLISATIPAVCAPSPLATRPLRNTGTGDCCCRDLDPHVRLVVLCHGGWRVPRKGEASPRKERSSRHHPQRKLLGAIISPHQQIYLNQWAPMKELQKKTGNKFTV
jgi:hypothetical protein